ncbi:MAG: SRPBCC family protein [Bacteroidia bacterium]
MPVNISRITVSAPAEKVWEVITQPAWVKQWQYGSDLHTDWKPGSDIRFETEWEGQIFKQWGSVLEFNPNEKLRYSLFAPRPDLEDIPEHYFEMEYSLSSNGNSTELVISQTDNRPGAKQEPEQGEENPVMAMLKSLIEG